MPFTDRSDLFASLEEEGVNLFVRHLMRQRPSLFNYATVYFEKHPSLLCAKIDAANKVKENGDPLFSVQEPIPILGVAPPISLNWSLQITDVEVDFHPGNTIELPKELGALDEQQLGLRMKACLGLDCPSKGLLEELLPGIEAEVSPRPPRENEDRDGDGKPDRPREEPKDEPDPYVPSTRELICVCLELYAVAHVEWGTIPGIEGEYAKPKLDGLEIVDIAPKELEGQLECYLETVLKLGLLPRVNTPIESLVLDITGLLADRGLELGQSVRIEPAAVPADVPNNPAIEDDSIKVFANLVVEEI